MGVSATKESKELPKFVPLPHQNKNHWKIVEDIDISKVKDWNSLHEIMNELCGTERKHDFFGLEHAISSSQGFGKEKFYGELLPFLLGLLKRTPEVFGGGKEYPFLAQKTNSRVVLTKEEVSVFLVNAFFSTFQDFKNGREEWACNEFNFWGLHCTAPSYRPNQAKEYMILNYFWRVMKDEINCKEDLVIERKHHVFSDQVFLSSSKPLQKVTVYKKGLIEDSQTSRQADFANMYIGGGTLQMGNVQEEIRFSVNTECILTMLFCPCMYPDEAIVIYNSERFSNYTGYGGSLGYGGNYNDEFAGKYEIVAMDGLDFRGGGARDQWKKENIDRELWKSFVAFHGSQKRIISSGNWGCGAFRGDKELKFVIQWLSASENEMDMDYYTFEDLQPALQLSKRIDELQKIVMEKKLSVGDVYKILMGMKNFDGGSTFEALKKEF